MKYKRNILWCLIFLLFVTCYSCKQDNKNDIIINDNITILGDLINVNKEPKGVYNSHYLETLEYSSQLLYKDNIDVYRKESFYVDPEYYKEVLHKNFNMIIILSENDMKRIKQNIHFSYYLENNFFEQYYLGIIIISLTGLNYLINEKIYNKNNNLIFSVEKWNWNSDVIPARAFRVMYILKIPR
jgi:predicted glycosyltransferase